MNARFKSLSFAEQKVISKTFTGKPDYSFSLITQSEQRYEQRKQMFLRMAEFKSIYTSLTSYIVAQLEKHLLPGTSIQVQGTDHWPWFNYAEKFLQQLSHKNNYERTLYSCYNSDVIEYNSLHDLSQRSKKTYNAEKAFFSTTDVELVRPGLTGLNDLRRILTFWKVPVKVNGMKTIDEVRIHTPLLIDALKKEIERLKNDRFFSSYNETKIDSLVELIDYLYDQLPEEKKKIIKQQKAAYLQNFPVQKGDVLELKDGRLVIADSVAISKNNSIEIKYQLLKTGLAPSVRQRTVSIEDILFYLPTADLEEYQKYIPVKHLSLLKKWMEKKKSRIIVDAFVPDLTQNNQFK